MAVLTARFDKALFYSSILSRALPARPDALDSTARALATAALVIGGDGDEDEAIAGLLFALVQHADDDRLLAEIGTLFGDGVLAILQDGLAAGYRRIGSRRRGGLGNLVGGHPRSALLGLADSMIEAIMLHSGLTERGSQAWKAFPSHREDVLRHFEMLAQTFDTERPSALATSFSSVVSELVCAASPYNEDPIGVDEPLPFRPRIVSDDE